MNFEEKINELKIKLPEAKAPVGSYVATKISGKLLFISGQISIDENGELIKGKVGKDLDTDEAYQAAKRCGLSIVSQVKKACGGDLSKIKSCIKLTGFVNSTDDFIDQPKVINGASFALSSSFSGCFKSFILTGEYIFLMSNRINFLFETSLLKLIVLKSFHSVWIITKSESLIADLIFLEKLTFLIFLNSSFSPVGS